MTVLIYVCDKTAKGPVNARPDSIVVFLMGILNCRWPADQAQQEGNNGYYQ